MVLIVVKAFNGIALIETKHSALASIYIGLGLKHRQMVEMNPRI